MILKGFHFFQEELRSSKGISKNQYLKRLVLWGFCLCVCRGVAVFVGWFFLFGFFNVECNFKHHLSFG